MKILITGGNGQLGKAFQELFLLENIAFISTDYNELDITDLKTVRNYLKDKGITHIINCAAYNAVDKAEEDWQKAFSVNGLGVRNLALCSNEYGTELIHYSSDYVFSGKKEVYTIYDKPDPVNKYGESKALGEAFLKLANRGYLIRVSWVFGDGEQNFLQKVICWSKKNSELKIVDDEISSPTYTVDLAKVTLELIKLRAYGLYHITNTPCSRYEWAEFVLNEINWNGHLKRAKQVDFNLPAKRPKISILDNYGLYETIGIKLRDWEIAVKACFEEGTIEK